MAKAKKTSKTSKKRSTQNWLSKLWKDATARDTGLILLSGLLIIGFLQIPSVKQFINASANAQFIGVNSGTSLEQNSIGNTPTMLDDSQEEPPTEPPEEKPPVEPPDWDIPSGPTFDGQQASPVSNLPHTGRFFNLAPKLVFAQGPGPVSGWNDFRNKVLSGQICVVHVFGLSLTIDDAQYCAEYRTRNSDANRTCQKKKAAVEVCLKTEYQKKVDNAQKDYEECLKNQTHNKPNICKKFNTPYWIWAIGFRFNPCDRLSSDMAKGNNNPCADSADDGGGGGSGSGGGGGGGSGSGGTGGGSGSGGSGGSSGFGDGGTGGGGGDAGGGSDDGDGDPGDGGEEDPEDCKKVAPDLISPEDESVYAEGSLSFEWELEDGACTPDKYELNSELGGKELQYWPAGKKDMGTSATLTIDQEEIQEIFIKQDNINYAKPFDWDWWVTAIYPDDIEDYDSDTWTIDVQIVNAPTIIQPSQDEYQLKGKTVTIEWEPGFEDNPTGYLIELRGLQSGTKKIQDVKAVTKIDIEIESILDDFPDDTSISLRVASNFKGALAWSEPKTLLLPVYVIENRLPENNGSYAPGDEGGELIFTWELTQTTEEMPGYRLVITYTNATTGEIIPNYFPSSGSTKDTFFKVSDSRLKYWRDNGKEPKVTWHVEIKVGTKIYASDEWTLNLE